MILALFACEPGAVILKDDTASVGDDTAIDETGDDTSVDTVDTVDTGGDDVQMCGNMAGIVGEGTRWEYDPLQPQSTSTRERVVTSVDGDRVLVEDSQVTEGENYSYGYTYIYDYRCDESGMWLLGSQYVMESVSGGQVYTYSYDVGYNAPVQVAPATVEFGSVWTSEYDGYYTYDNGMETPFNYTQLNTVVGADPMELAIGEVTVYRVISEMGAGSTTSYYGEKVGLVQDAQWEIADYDP